MVGDEVWIILGAYEVKSGDIIELSGLYIRKFVSLYISVRCFLPFLWFRNAVCLLIAIACGLGGKDEET